MDLQELITRGRFLFSRASERFAVFQRVNGRRTADEISRSTKRYVTNVDRDLRLLSDAELIRPRIGADGRAVRTKDFVVYEKVPLARTVPATYFHSRIQPLKQKSQRRKSRPKATKAHTMAIPSGQEILDICNQGEGQVHEFKGAGTDVRKVTKEIAALLNTRQGGIVFYGIDDNGKIQGTDITRQAFDQRLQNSVRNSINPAAYVTLRVQSVLGSDILIIVVPPWNETDVYMFEEKVLIRRGTNTFAAKPEELRKLFRGEPVI